jgi:tetratricopeptide (TPR) repeat protein
MYRVSSLATVPERVLDRWIRRLVLLVAVALVAFVGIYAADRWRPASPPIVDQRMAALEEAVRADPNDIAARGQLADLYAVNGRYQEAIVQYDAILETGKADMLAHLSRGRANQELGALDAAAADFAAVVELLAGSEMANIDPNLEAAYYGLGAIALAQGRPADAIEQLEKALAIKRSDADALNLIGQAYAAAGRPDDAITALRRAIDFVPIGWEEPYRALAAAYADAGDADLSAWATAMVAMQSGDLTAAEEGLTAVLEGSAAVDARIGLALIAETRGDTDAAAAWYAEALGLDPDNVAAQLGASRVRPPEGVPSTAPLPELPAPGAEGGDQ